ncbi:phytanoyl-CoA dioxygenase family protein [Bacillus sp. NP157]|nr:phytanoyl-CoA dioxygenase family protein [Bacillus sp. NP157]
MSMSIPAPGALATAFARDGVAILPPLISEHECEHLAGLVAAEVPCAAGSRSLLDLEEVRGVAERLACHPSVAALLPEGARAIQCSLFAKSAATNWYVTPHQDLSIAVPARHDREGWSAWSVKEGIWFAQPPVPTLESVVAIRVQLDPESAVTGPLEVVPGSHRLGRLSHAEVLAAADRGLVPCHVERGGAVAMRPLIVHASARALSDIPRRVLHFVYATGDLA